MSSQKVKRYGRAWLGILLGLALAVPVLAQDAGLTLTVRKQMGYSMGSQIQGTFKLKVQGPADLAAVTFRMDGEEMDTVTAAPFELSFNTASYAIGWHELSAVGRTAGGQTVESKVLRYEFLSSEQANRDVLKFIGPVLALVLGAMLLSALGPLLTGRREAVYRPELYDPTQPRGYGMLGATICPKCGRPFGLHWWGINVSFVGKYDRCPYCRKWSLVRRAGREELLAAEAAEHAAYASPPPAAPGPQEEEAKLKQQLDDSRFMGL